MTLYRHSFPCVTYFILCVVRSTPLRESPYRWAEHHYERMPELVSRHVAVIAARKALWL